MPGLILASTSDNAPGGAVLTFAFPIILFAVIAVILYWLFSRPHRRIPSRRVAMVSASAAAPHPGAAHAAAVAAGMPTASGGGSAESVAEAHGAKAETATAPDDGETTTGSVSGEAGGPNTSTGNTEASE